MDYDVRFWRVFWVAFDMAANCSNSFSSTWQLTHSRWVFSYVLRQLVNHQMLQDRSYHKCFKSYDNWTFDALVMAINFQFALLLMLGSWQLFFSLFCCYHSKDFPFSINLIFQVAPPKKKGRQKVYFIHSPAPMGVLMKSFDNSFDFNCRSSFLRGKLIQFNFWKRIFFSCSP